LYHLIFANARKARCAYAMLNGDESTIFCVSLQVAEKLATTFLRTTSQNRLAGYQQKPASASF
jgi:hypothetical protein